MSEKIRRNREIKLRLSDDEHARLSALAGDAPLAAWLRDFALDAAQSTVFDVLAKKRERTEAMRQKKLAALTVDPQLLRGLAGIGNNINQIARIMNTNAKAGSPLDLAAVAIELRHISEALERVRKDNQQGDLPL